MGSKTTLLLTVDALSMMTMVSELARLSMVSADAALTLMTATVMFPSLASVLAVAMVSQPTEDPSLSTAHLTGDTADPMATMMDIRPEATAPPTTREDATSLLTSMTRRRESPMAHARTLVARMPISTLTRSPLTTDTRMVTTRTRNTAKRMSVMTTILTPVDSLASPVDPARRATPDNLTDISSLLIRLLPTRLPKIATSSSHPTDISNQATAVDTEKIQTVKFSVMFYLFSVHLLK